MTVGETPARRLTYLNCLREWRATVGQPAALSGAAAAATAAAAAADVVVKSRASQLRDATSADVVANTFIR